MGLSGDEPHNLKEGSAPCCAVGVCQKWRYGCLFYMFGALVRGIELIGGGLVCRGAAEAAQFCVGNKALKVFCDLGV